ncbi:MAG: hypothetical protein KatS3mg101_0993 [Patescibacteria group bacterium]|nr:MAG: hypothetical protein KatS3mg101_0993 [Patescibacteria group bacterium]
MNKERGLFYPDGSFRGEDEIRRRNLKEPSIQRPVQERGGSFDDDLRRMQEIQRLREEQKLWKDEVKISVQTNLPYFFLMPLSDIHLGAEGTDYQAVRKFLGVVKDYPVYTVLLGDLGDFFNPYKHPTGMAEDVVNADSQLLAMRNFFKEYKEKILAVATGNHDDWIYKTSGIEPYRWVCQDLNIPLLYSGGRLNLQVNEVNYKILLYHAIARFNSSFNPTHAGKRMLELHHDADIVISGDKHRFGMEKLVHRDKKPYIVQLGTFKTGDTYGKRSYGFAPDSQIGFPVLFLSAGEKNVEAIEDIETAKHFVDLVRKG